MDNKSVSVSRVGDVWVLTFQVNAITPAFLSSLHSAFDRIESTPGPASVLLRSDRKVFSGGMDLKYWVNQPVETRKVTPISILCELVKLMGRMVSFPVPIVAEIAGQCYAGGYMLAVACDYRVMSETEAKICLNEVEMPLAPPAGATRVLTTKLPSLTVRDLLTGRIFSPHESLSLQIIDFLYPKSQIHSKSLEFAQSLSHFGLKREAYGLLKRQMYGQAADLCEKAALTHDEFECLARLKPRL